jgi:hypothetical protein
VTKQPDTESPSCATKEQETQKRPRGKRAQPQDVPLEKLSVVVRLGDKRQIFDLALARRREAERRLRTLGAYAHEEFDKKRLRTFVRERFVAERELTHWKHEYVLHTSGGGAFQTRNSRRMRRNIRRRSIHSPRGLCEPGWPGTKNGVLPVCCQSRSVPIRDTRII